ncbi:MAG TPA: protoporphyrinogen oxidase, partial [Trueperaceae bacterium]|nr:protoporphyrinogen oxidase [Trueperaceae bacterium]
FDLGPNGFMAGAPDTLALVNALGVEGQLLPASAAAQRRYLYVRGGLELLPSSPPAALKSRLLSAGGKARALLEVMRRPQRPASDARAAGGSGAAERIDELDETVHAFMARHFGREAADLLGPALVTGVTAGDARQLSLDAVFPRLRALERQHGSLLRGMAAAGRAARAAQAGAGANRLTSFPGGMLTLTNALAHALSGALTTASEVIALEPDAQGFHIRTVHGQRISARQVVLAAPAYASSTLLAPFAVDAAKHVANIPYAAVGVFGLTYPRAAVPDALDGFGFLAAPGQAVRLLGVQYTSTLFPDQVPAGTVSLRVICGGTLDPGFLALSDEEALASVRKDLSTILHIEEEPVNVSYARWPRGIPQYHLGHGATVRSARRDLARWPGLHLAGNGYDGVAVNDCVRNARRLASELQAAAESGTTSRPGATVATP